MSEFRTIPPKLTATEWNALLDHGLVKPASYIIRKNGSYYEAINGNTGKIDYSGTDASQVIQSAINALTNGGKIFIKDPITISGGSVSISKPIVFEGEGEHSTITMDNSFLYIIAGWAAFHKLRFTGIVTEGSGLIATKVPVYIRDCIFEDISGGACVIVSSITTKPPIFVSDSIFNNCQVTDAVIFLMGSSTINNNQFYNCVANKGVIRQNAGSNSIICNNLIQDYLGTGDYHHAITLYSQNGDIEDVIIAGNTIFWTADPSLITGGILLSTEVDASYNIRRCVIANNVIKGSETFTNVSVAIYCHVGASGVIEDIAITGNSIKRVLSGIVLRMDKRGSIIGNVIEQCTRKGIYIYCDDSLVLGNIIKDVNYELVSGNAGIVINGNNNTVEGNRIIDSLDYTTYSIIEENGDSNQIKNNNVDKPIQKTGANTIIKGNIGYITENIGVATISAGSTSVTVNHGLAGTPTIVFIEVNHDELKDYKITNKTSTQFTVEVPNAVSADRTFTWKAWYEP